MTQVHFKFYLTFLLIATIADLFVPVLIGFRYTGYNHLHDTISSLGTSVSPVQRYECLNLIIVGFLLVIFTMGQYRLFESIKWSHLLYLTGILLFGIGTVFAGFFPEDPVGAQETFSGKIHGIASGIGFLFLILNPLWAIWIKEFEDFDYCHITIFILAFFSFILFIISGNKDSGIFKYTGLFQRLDLLILYGYTIINYIRSGI